MTTPTLRDAAMAALKALSVVTSTLMRPEKHMKVVRDLRLALTAPEQSPADGAPAAPTSGEPWGWAIVDKNGDEHHTRPRLCSFFGAKNVPSDPFDADDLAKANRDAPGLAPYSIVTLYVAAPGATPPSAAQAEGARDLAKRIKAEAAHWAYMAEIDNSDAAQLANHNLGLLVDQLAALTAAPEAEVARVSERWCIVCQTALDVGLGDDVRTGGRPELGYALIADAGTFDSEDAARLAHREANLPLGWVVMPLSRLLPDLALTAAPEKLAPAPQQAAQRKLRAPSLEWLQKHSDLDEHPCTAGAPAARCPRCGDIDIGHDAGEPWDGPSWVCRRCWHSWPATNPSPQQAAQGGEREAFEIAHRAAFGRRVVVAGYEDAPYKKLPNGEYADVCVGDTWTIWQARASLGSAG